MTADLTPLRSVHTNNFPALLNHLGLSLLVSTYQAGKLIVVRADGESLNTHFRIFNKPMGLAATPYRLALGTAFQIWEFHNQPDVAPKLMPRGKHDACYLPRQINFTGDIDIHEMAWIEGELWFINTRFSCLCTLDKNYSFVPRWRPAFITAYDLQDRCHLNGLAARDRQPKYVTALGMTDTPNGWRQNKAFGGILMDITTNEILLQGLSMPHSPRWYQDKLWFLESGRGSLSYLDLTTRTVQTVAQLPGFTRGLDFWGNLAFIGLSQVRESAVFSGIPLTQRLAERICGVWVVNIQTGETLAFLKFEEAIQEIFAVAVLPGLRFPDVLNGFEGEETLLGGSFVLPDEVLAATIAPPARVASAQACLNQGNELYAQGKWPEAIAVFRQALEIQPDFLPARFNLGVVLSDVGEYPEAIEQLKQVIAAEAAHADAHNSLGFIYCNQKKLVEAIHHYQRAIQIRPDFAKAHHNLGMTLLQMGEYPQGWAECEWRWQTEQFFPLKCPQPQWQGQEIPGKTLLIHTEQGAGDAIQFLRFVPLAAARCGRVILAAPTELIPLFATMPEISELQPSGDIALSAFDYYIPLMSLPHVLGNTLDTIPDLIPYLQVNPQHCQPLPAIAAVPRPKLKVGIVWGGSPTQANDKNRSCPLRHFLPFLQIPEIAFYSLQKGDQRTQELADLPPDLPLLDLSPHLTSFAETAGLIQQLDLVITVDTSVAHLSGALGKPVWTLLCHNADWRWLLERSETPWYPTMQLFRQTEPGDWAGVCDRVRQELQSLKQSQRSPLPPPRKPLSSPRPKQSHPALAISSLVVVVPVYNVIQKQQQKVFLRTLDSINSSIGVFQRHFPYSDQVGIEVVLVDDGSTDATPEMLAKIEQYRPFYRVIRHSGNRGQAAARNTGVWESSGQAVFFCDADDRFQETHLLHAFTLLNQPAPPVAQSNLRQLAGYPAAVKTRIHIQDPIHPEWQQRLDSTLCLNLCVRRQVHEWLGGFPEDQIFREFTYGNEDWAYMVWLHECFQVLSLPIATVEYVRYPGNLLDRQLRRFQSPPGAYQEPMSERDQQLMVEIDQLIQARTLQFHQKHAAIS